MWPTYLCGARAGRTGSATRRSRSISARPTSTITSNLYGLFVQDDWRLSDRVKMLYGVRYDLYDVPGAIPTRRLKRRATSSIDKNNWAPRFGRRLDAGRQPPVGGPCQHRHHVRPGAACDVRAGADQRRHQPPRGGVVSARDARGAGISGRVVGRCGCAAEYADHGVAASSTSRANWQNNLQFERQLGEQFAVAVGTSYVARLQPAGDQQHQPDQSDPAPGGRTAGLLHGDQRQPRGWIPATT